MAARDPRAESGASSSSIAQTDDDDAEDDDDGDDDARPGRRDGDGDGDGDCDCDDGDDDDDGDDGDDGDGDGDNPNAARSPRGVTGDTTPLARPLLRGIAIVIALTLHFATTGGVCRREPYTTSSPASPSKSFTAAPPSSSSSSSSSASSLVHPPPRPTPPPPSLSAAARTLGSTSVLGMTCVAFKHANAASIAATVNPSRACVMTNFPTSPAPPSRVTSASASIATNASTASVTSNPPFAIQSLWSWTHERIWTARQRREEASADASFAGKDFDANEENRTPRALSCDATVS
jgi:hypothetical protein